MKDLPAGHERTEISEELPSGMERRLVLRLLSHWRSLCDERKFPSFMDVDPTEIPDIWACSFVLELMDDESEPVFRAMGDELAAFSESSLIGCRISEVPADSLAGVSVAYIDEVMEKEVPISRGGEFYTAHGTKVLYRSIILPMSDDGETISGLLGAANCREISEEEE